MRGPGRGRWQAIREFLYGLTGHEFARQAVSLRRDLEGLFILVTYGDLIGVPVMPPYYAPRAPPARKRPARSDRNVTRGEDTVHE